jgi:7,8-didemethyl-8-hydroxy-5-deazariboflavin synthase CofH subunit
MPHSLLDQLFAVVGGPIRRILDGCLAGAELTWPDAVTLAGARGLELHALLATADTLRRQQVGDTVTYVVNRNINFTNVCVMSCQFCAFSRQLRSEQGYFLELDDIVDRARQAYEMGATEVCLQAGLAPIEQGRFYVDMIRAVKTALPELHIHALSPEEVKYGAKLARTPIRAFLAELKDAGLGSLPGTSAEILDDRIREQISPGRITTAQWIEVIRTAHELGLPTTATMMFGHVESVADCMRHMDLLRSLQRETRGFTEFVPLSFVHSEAPLFAQHGALGVQAGPTGDDVVRLYAIARLMLGPDLPNLQASWVKEGARMAQWLLHCGVNDLGGTLMNESISTSAGAQHGQLMTPAALRALIRGAGRSPAQRGTDYRLVRTFTGDGVDDPVEPLDQVRRADDEFGSYVQLTRSPNHRYHRRRVS